MTDYINNIEYESIVAIAVQDSGGGIAFDDVAAAVMESLGAGTNDCPVHIGKFSLSNKLFHCHRCEILNSSCWNLMCFYFEKPRDELQVF